MLIRLMGNSSVGRNLLIFRCCVCVRALYTCFGEEGDSCGMES